MTAEDGLPDDRVACDNCHNVRGHWCQARNIPAWLEEPLRCLEYRPTMADPDSRTGSARWPRLKAQIADARKADQEFRR